MQTHPATTEQHFERIPDLLLAISQFDHQLSGDEEKSNICNYIENMSLELLNMSKKMNSRLLTYLLSMTVHEARLSTDRQLRITNA